MGFLRRVLGGSKAPTWAAGFMRGDQYAAFERLLQADLRARGWPFELRDGGVFVDLGGPEPAGFGLTNIAQLCAAIDPAEWPGAIRTHFDHIAGAPGGGDERSMAWADVAPLVKPRIYPAEFARQLSLAPHPICPELAAAIAIDFPTTVATPQGDATSDWPMADEVFAVALHNLRAEGEPEASVLDVEGVPIHAYIGDSFFVAAHLLRLRELAPMAGTNHALVAVPNRHTLVLHPIVDTGVLKVVGPMASIAANRCEAGPGSIVPDLFWWHGGALTRIPVTFDGKRTNVVPPDAFVELLNGLAAAGPATDAPQGR